MNDGADQRLPDRPAPRGEGSGPRTDLTPEFLERLRRRDPEALGEFYETFFDRVYAYVRRMVGEEHLAEDVTQDVFMHIYRSLDTYDPARDVRPWVFTIATNTVRDFWRSRQHRDAQRALDVNDEEGIVRAASQDRGPEGWLENKELGRDLVQAVESLPESMRSTLLLRYFEGLSFEAIAEMLGRNEAAVRKRYSRALEELRHKLGRSSSVPEGGRP